MDSFSNENKMPSLNLLEYDGYSNFAAVLKNHAHTGREHVVGFSGVSADEFNLLSSDRHRPLKSAKFSYNSSTEVLIIKIPGYAHGVICGLFSQMVNQQLFMMDVSHEFISMASPLTPLTVLGNCVKAPDTCWSPFSTCALTVVLEVGASLASAAWLEIDARKWLETPGTAVKKCITIDVSAADNSSTIAIDVWQLCRRLDIISTRNRPSRATRVQHAEIVNGETGPEISGWTTDENTDVSSPTDEIRLDFDMFVGRPAANTVREKDIVIDRDLLVEFANRFWRYLGRSRQG